MSPTTPPPSRPEASTTTSESAAGDARTDEEGLSPFSESKETLGDEEGGTHAPAKTSVHKSVQVTSTGSGSTDPELQAMISLPSDALSSSSADLPVDSAKWMEAPPIPAATTPSGDIAASELWRRDLAGQILDVFTRATGETFEDGKESVFARRIKALVKTRGVEAVRMVANTALSGRTRADVAAEALKAIGLLQDPSTYDERKVLLEKALFSKLPYVREAAVLGIESMRDRRSLPWLMKAMEAEQIEDLRDSMMRAVRRLEGDR